MTRTLYESKRDDAFAEAHARTKEGISRVAWDLAWDAAQKEFTQDVMGENGLMTPLDRRTAEELLEITPPFSDQVPQLRTALRTALRDLTILHRAFVEVSDRAEKLDAELRRPNIIGTG